MISSSTQKKAMKIYPKIPAMTKEEKLQAKIIRDKHYEEVMDKFDDQEAEWLYKQTYGDAREIVQEPDSGFNQAEVVQEQTVIMKSIQERPRSNSRNRMISKEGSSNKNLPLASKVVVDNSNITPKTNPQMNYKEANKPSPSKLQQGGGRSDYRSRA
jgi:hypothetical protein